MNNQSLKFLLTAVLLIPTASLLGFAEEIRVHTYYPSPRGFYENLRSTHNALLATDGASLFGVATETPAHLASINGGVIIGATAAINQVPPHADFQGMLVEGPIGVGLPNSEYSLAVSGSAVIGENWAGTAAPANSLIVESVVRVTEPLSTPTIAADAPALLVDADPSIMYIEGNRPEIVMNNDWVLKPDGWHYDILSRSGGTDTVRLSLSQEGHIGIGTTNHTQALIVEGNGNVVFESAWVRVNAYNPAGNYRLAIDDGELSSTGSFYCGATDIAEEFPFSRLDRPLEPGDVLSVDLDSDEQLRLAARPYDPHVAGVITTEPGMVLGEERDGQKIALVGRVPVKAVAENGPIKRGDLLVSASKPGYAMRGDTDRVQVGTVIGKAMSELPEGEGRVWVLVNLN